MYKHFKKQDQILFLTSLCVLLSTIFSIVTLCIQLKYILSQFGEDRLLFYNLYRSLVSLAILFIILSFLFDMFKWAIFLMSASI